MLPNDIECGKLCKVVHGIAGLVITRGGEGAERPGTVYVPVQTGIIALRQA